MEEVTQVRRSVHDIGVSERAEIAEMYEGKAPLKDIRSRYNTTDGVIYQVVRNFGMKPNRNNTKKRKRKATQAPVSGEKKPTLRGKQLVLERAEVVYESAQTIVIRGK